MNLTEGFSIGRPGFYNGGNISLNGSTDLQLSNNPTIDKAVNVLIIFLPLVSMVSLGCTMEISKIKANILKPKGIGIALLAQFGIMPLTAFCLAKIFQLGPIEALAALICGCCPGGNLSNIFSLALKGDMNLSIVMTTFSTVSAVGMMPLLLFVFCQGFNNLESAVPYSRIIIGLIITLVPCGIGIAINHLKPNYSSFIIKVGLSIFLILVVAIGIMLGITIGPTLWVIFSWKLMAVAALMPLIGYMLGYVISTIFRVNHQQRRTISMETGCQNVQLCAAILKVAFPLQVIGPLFLFPHIYLLFQAGEAILLILLFRCCQKSKPPTEENPVYQTVDHKLVEVNEPQRLEGSEPNRKGNTDHNPALEGMDPNKTI